MRGAGKIAAATFLLLVGVASAGAAAETHTWWWAFGGSLCLMFVPALTADAVVEKVQAQRRDREKQQ